MTEINEPWNKVLRRLPDTKALYIACSILVLDVIVLTILHLSSQEALQGWLSWWQSLTDLPKAYVPAFNNAVAEMNDFGYQRRVPMFEHVFGIGWLVLPITFIAV